MTELSSSRRHEQQIRVHLRWMIRRDMPEVLGIEARSFEYPWLKEDFVDRRRGLKCMGMVAEHGDSVVGFMIYQVNERSFGVLNFAVAEEYHRRGVGSQMMAELVGKLSWQRRNRITLGVRESNLPAQLFFRAMGLRCERILRGEYDDTEEDMYVFTMRRLRS
jgi:ribosomal-protein-alanine N-acetyltransferase